MVQYLINSDYWFVVCLLSLREAIKCAFECWGVDGFIIFAILDSF